MKQEGKPTLLMERKAAVLAAEKAKRQDTTGV
jgi:hypothetical protein